MKNRWEEQMKEFNIAVQVQNKIKQQLLKACPTKFLTMLENEQTGFVGVIPQAIMQYLKSRFREMSLKDMQENQELTNK